MDEPELPRPAYGQQRICPHCGTRVAQKAQRCFFCGEALESAPRWRLQLPWADLTLFAAIAAVLAIWWVQAPEPPDARIAQLPQAAVMTPTAALAAALQLDEPTPTPTQTPAPSATIEPTATAAPAEIAAAATSIPAEPLRHTVQAGESVALIAGKYSSTIKDIISVNSLSADGRLSIGQVLVIPVAGPTGGEGPTPTPGPSGLMVTVRSGDTISGLAERHKSRVDWIIQANNIQPGETLHIGRALLIPLVPATPTPTPTVEAPPTPALPTPTPGLTEPQLLTPPDAAVISGESSVLLSWTSVGVLDRDEWYVVTLKSPEKNATIATWWTKSTSWRLPETYRPTGSAGLDYYWRVQVRSGDPENPGPLLSPVSLNRRFTWR